MSNTLMQQLIAYPSQAPSSTELWLAYPERLYDFTPEEADFLTAAVTESLVDLADMLAEEAAGSISAKQMKEQLLSPFIYAFGKGVEIVYKMRTDPDDPVEFDPDEMDGDVGENVSEDLQMKLTSALPIVNMIFEETIDFADQEATSVLDIDELFQSILTGGMFLGVEFCVRQELQDV
jgi:hypothetical protein